jgi:hypothetical protein
MQNVRGVWHCAWPRRRLASKAFETFGRRESDPGVRNDPAAAGKPLKGLRATPNALFEAGRDDFAEAETVADGLGPRFNLDNWSARAT